ncbi:MAG: ATP-dependent DNA helicase RecG [Planctomycetia bacterium]|nr:ATP-dependent DNA helicase RecG [Planctomycetia bacterium]
MKETAERPVRDEDPLRCEINWCKGVGPSRALILNRLGIFRAVDLLFYFPREYQDMRDFRSPDQLEPDKLQTVSGEIVRWEIRPTKRGQVVVLDVLSNNEYIQAIWFNQPMIIYGFAPGRRLLLTGKPKNKPTSYSTWQMAHPKIAWLPDLTEEEKDLEPSELFTDPYLPVYPLTEGLQQYHLRKILKFLLEDLPDQLPEVFPEKYLRDHQLLPIADAVRGIHFPADPDHLEKSRRRFIYQEFFILQLALAIRRQQHQTALKAPIMELTARIDSRIRRILPYALTGGQNKVVQEIAEDLGKPVPMNRLLQGDVGSGKTLVAVYAILQTIACGKQAVLMAPTEVLARQHLTNIENLLSASRIRIAPVFGGQPARQRAMILQEIKTGAAQLIVGTQAIICSEIEFKDLGLVVIDEQHKFGVRQRARLKSGTKFDPHYLVMTATPIPRSITMTLFGDLDVSVLDELPPGRSKITTKIVNADQRAKWWDFFRKKLKDGRQGYVVVSRVSEQEDEDLRSVISTYEDLSSGILSDYRLAFLHGRMKSEEKESIMNRFRNGEIDVLIATSVIEVGVDVPNASLMAIENADRFGIAQLHQLRGRIGRGCFPGFCALFPTERSAVEISPEEYSGTSNKAEMERKKEEAREKKMAESLERLRIFESTSDGFELAEKDLEIRGPGELFGTRQHGVPPMMIADLIRDRSILQETRKDALDLVRSDPGLSEPDHAKLRKQLLLRYGKLLDIGDVG